MIAATLMALGLAMTSPSARPEPVEGQHPQPAAVPGDYAYQLFLPRGYLASGKVAWPLIIFLHGSGERGSDIEKVKVNGPPRIIADHPGSPFILVSPQLPEGNWDVATLDRLLATLRKRYRVDASRIYLTGLSRGGYGTWDWAIARPDLFAAIAPVAGKADITQACTIKDLPIWAFHGDNDDIVPPIGSFAMVEAVRTCKGAVPPRLTIYPGTNHGSWVPAYDDPALYRWLLEQRRAVPAPTTKTDIKKDKK
jgi:predicted peptidase